VSLLIAFIALFVATFLMPFFLQRGQAFSALQAGLHLTPLSLTTLVVSPSSGALHDALYFAAGACLIGVFASLVRGSRDPTEDATTPEVSSGHNQRLMYLASQPERRE
jgi:hypothetical protein